MKSLIFVLLIYIMSQPLSIFGQDNDTIKIIKKPKHSVGIGAGFTTGFGLSYRFMPKKIGIQTTFLILPKNYYSNFSATILYKLIQRQYSWFYLYQSNLYSTYKNSGSNSGSPYFEWFNGFGFGVELIMGKHIGLNLMGGTGFYRSFKEFTVTGESGLYFKF
jgi:hypothetical protein